VLAFVSRAVSRKGHETRMLYPRISVVAISAMVAIGAGLSAGGCQSDGASDEQPARDADAQGSQAHCRVESAPRVRPDVRAVAFAYGEGPVFVGLGTGDGVVRYTVDTRRHDGWYYYKTLWAIAPISAGEVVISGREIRGSHELRFNPAARFPGQKLRRLRFPPDDSGKWRYGPSDTLIRAPGCYAFHVTGEGIRQTIAFEARD
jgi:hypothetical protein